MNTHARLFSVASVLAWTFLLAMLLNPGGDDGVVHGKHEVPGAAYVVMKKLVARPDAPDDSRSIGRVSLLADNCQLDGYANDSFGIFTPPQRPVGVAIGTPTGPWVYNDELELDGELRTFRAMVSILNSGQRAANRFIMKLYASVDESLDPEEDTLLNEFEVNEYMAPNVLKSFAIPHVASWTGKRFVGVLWTSTCDSGITGDQLVVGAVTVAGEPCSCTYAPTETPTVTTAALPQTPAPASASSYNSQAPSTAAPVVPRYAVTLTLPETTTDQLTVAWRFDFYENCANTIGIDTCDFIILYSSGSVIADLIFGGAESRGNARMAAMMTGESYTNGTGVTVGTVSEARVFTESLTSAPTTAPRPTN